MEFLKEFTRVLRELKKVLRELRVAFRAKALVVLVLHFIDIVILETIKCVCHIMSMGFIR